MAPEGAIYHIELYTFPLSSPTVLATYCASFLLHIQISPQHLSLPPLSAALQLQDIRARGKHILIARYLNSPPVTTVGVPSIAIRNIDLFTFRATNHKNGVAAEWHSTVINPTHTHVSYRDTSHL